MQLQASASSAGRARTRWCATASLRCGRTPRTTPDPTGSRHAQGLLLQGPDRALRRRPRATARRTHPGPKEDRLRLTRATRANISPIFSLYSDPQQLAWSALAPATQEQPWGEVSDGDSTVHRIWRVSDPHAIDAVRAATSDAELLIADGHHRYETMQAYAQEVDDALAARAPGTPPGEPPGEHRYILMCLVALEDPGLTIFPTHRLLSGLDAERRDALHRVLQRDFIATEVPLAQLAPNPARARWTSASMRARSDQRCA